MSRIRRTQTAIAVVFGVATLFALKISDAEDNAQSTNRFRLTVTDVVVRDDVVVKQIRIDAKPDSRARVESDKAGSKALSASARSVAGQPGQGILTVTVLADHFEWKDGDVNLQKDLISIDGNGASSVMSASGPIGKGKKLNDVIAVPLNPARTITARPFPS